MQLRFNRSQSGITLIEVICAMLVLSLGILALAPMMVISVTGNRFSDNVTTVAAAAQRAIEEKIAQGTFPNIPYQETDYAGDSVYTVTSTVKDNSVDVDIPANVFEITVAVYWQDESGLNRNMAFTTYVSKP